MKKILTLLTSFILLYVAIIQAQSAQADPDALVLLPLDEGSGTVAGDVSGLGNDGTLLNGALFEANSGDGSPSSVRFDGVDDYIDLGPLDVNGSGLTLATWFNADSFPGSARDPRFISKAAGTSANDHVFMLGTIRSGSATRLRARVRVGGSTTTLIADNGDLVTGVWQHAAVIYDGTTLRLYLDGVEVGNAPLSGPVDIDPLVPVTVGSQPPGAGARFFDGRLDDVRILQRALSVDEIAAILSGDPPPVTTDDGYNTDEDTTLVVPAASGLLSNDVDTNPPDDLTASLLTNPTNGTLTSFETDGGFIYLPDPDFNGSDSFTYEAVDGQNDTSSPATVTLTVIAVNDPPTAVDDGYETAPDTPLIVDTANGVLDNDSDPDQDPLQAVLVSDVSNGLLNLQTDGSFDYTPNSSFTGQDSFTYWANDGLLDSTLATVTIVVLAPPSVVDDAYSTDEDITLVVLAATGVLSNDVDTNPPDDLTASLLTNPANGTLTSFETDGAFTYLPDPDFNGSDSFTYEAVDGQNGTTSPATVTLTVIAVNDPPTAVDDGYETAPDTPLIVDAANGVLDNDSDPDQDPLQAVLVGDVSNGLLNLQTDGSFDYTPNPGFSGQDSFTYRANDALLDSNPATVTISMAGDSDALVLLPLDEGSGTVAGDVSGLGNDGTLLNGALFEANSGDGSPSSVRFDGVDDYIDLGPLDVNGSGLTLATWFNADSFPGSARDPRFISKAAGTSANDHVFMLGTIRSGSATRLRARVRVGGSTTTLIADNGDLVTGVWQHAAVIYDGTTLRLYLDGVEVGNAPLSGPVDIDPLVPVTVGSQPPGAGARFFDGRLDDVRILQRALSVDEIAAILSGDPPPVTTDDGYNTDEDTTLVVPAASGLLSNDVDTNPPDDLTASLLTNPTNGTLTSFETDGGFIYLPDPDFNGSDSFTYEAVDGQNDTSSPATVTLTVIAVNDPPTAVDDGYETAPDTPLIVDTANGVLDNDSDPDQDPLQAVLVSDVSNGLLNLQTDGSFDYTPNSSFTGQDSFTYWANDGLLDSTLATVTIVVLAPPSVVDDAYSTDEDITLVVLAATGVLSNDVDTNPPDDLTASLLTNPANGTLTSFETDGAFTYLPDPDFNGSDSFTYEAVDGQNGTTSPATVTLTVIAVNDPPTAVDDGYETAPDTPLIVDAANGVLDNDSDPDQDPLQAVLVGDVSNGLLNLQTDGSFDYTPNPGFSGQDSFTYRANDALLDSNPATVTISMAGDSDALVLLPLDEGSGTVAGDVSGLGNDGTLLNGALFEANSGDGSPSSVRFDGVDDYIDLGPLDVNGSGLTLATWFNADSFPGSARDPRFISKAAGTSANDHVFMLGTIRSGSATRLRARVRVGGSTTTLIADNGDLVTGVWQHAAVIYDGTTLRLYLDGVEVGNAPLSGPVDIDPLVPVTVGSQPPGAGARFFDGRLDDVRILQRALSVDEIAAILSGDPPPVTTDDGYNTDEDTTLVVPAASGLLSNDVDTNPPDDLTASLLTNPTNGTLTSFETDGGFIYLPDPDFNGSDSFTYEAVDGQNDTSSPATVTLTVIAVNDPPTAVDDGYETAPDTPLIVDTANGVLDNDSDPDQDPLQAVLVSDVSNGLLNLQTDGSFDYTPNSSFTGQDSFTYWANDGLLDSTLATVTIVVLAPPSVVDDAYSTDEDITLVVLAATGVLSNDVDTNPPDDLTASLLTNPANGTLTSFETDGAFTYLPDPDFNGSDSFTYEAVDGQNGTTSPATVTLTVIAVNDPPTAVDDGYETAPDTPLIVDAANGVLDNDSDPDQDPLQAVLVGDVSNGLLNLQTDGSFDYTPNAGFSGQDSFTYWANDGLLDSNLATVTISMNVDNSPPQIVTGKIAFTKQVIDNAVDQTHFVLAADFTGDDLIDVVATDYVDDTVFWYENDGNGGFVTRILGANLNGAYPAHIADLDLDGDIDVFASGYLADTHVWYENDGTGNFTRHDVDTAADGAHSIVTGDMDMDGDIDLLTSNQDIGNIAWYENDGINNFTLHIIDTTSTGAKRAEFADIEGDGDMDVVTASHDADEVTWLENDGIQGFTKHIIDGTANGAYYATSTDVDGDGDVDVLAAIRFQNTFAWYENDGSGIFNKHIIDDGAIHARAIIVMDIDGDGDSDALGTSVNDDTVAWYENDGSGNFTTQWIDIGAAGAYGVFAIDMDDDGDVDVLSASRDANTVAFHSHVIAHHISVDNGGAFTFDATILQTVDADNSPADLIYTVTDGPNFGELQLVGTSIPVGGTFTQDDIDNGLLAYVHDASNSPVDGFSFRVEDGSQYGVRPDGNFTIIIEGSGEEIVELPLDEGGGTVAGDVSGLGNDGTLLNGALFEANSGDGSLSSVRFDGIDDFIDLGLLDVNGTGLTLAAWFNADSFPGKARDPRIISKASGLEADDHVFMLGTIRSSSAIRLRARVRVNGSTTTLIARNGRLLTGVWHHAAVTYDGVILRLYLDGVEVDSGPLSGSVDIDPSVPVAVGNQPPGAGARFFDGLLDDVRILQRPLSSGEIAEIVASGN